MNSNSKEQQELIRVFVDAKILGRDDPTKRKRTFVAYIVRAREDLQGFTEILAEGADETDEAELHAIAFAIRKLETLIPGVVVMSDNQSVVDVINRASGQVSTTKKILAEIMQLMGPKSPITVQWYENNPAHRFLNKRVSETIASENLNR